MCVTRFSSVGILKMFQFKGQKRRNSWPRFRFVFTVNVKRSIEIITPHRSIRTILVTAKYSFLRTLRYPQTQSLTSGSIVISDGKTDRRTDRQVLTTLSGPSCCKIRYYESVSGSFTATERKNKEFSRVFLSQSQTSFMFFPE